MIEQAKKIIKTASRIVAFSGAGLSAESGIATFRDAQTGGMWAKHDPMRLASPQGFEEDPALVIEWYAQRRKDIALAAPNSAHDALARRSDIINVTQNVDDLLHRAGAKQIIALHGSIVRDRCHSSCGYEETIKMKDPPGLRDCPDCGSQLRPAVVWFGESLPVDAWDKAERVCSECDVLLVIGTSAAVYPAAGLIDRAKSTGAKIIIVNTQSSDASHLADYELLGKASELVPRILL